MRTKRATSFALLALMLILGMGSAGSEEMKSTIERPVRQPGVTLSFKTNAGSFTAKLVDANVRDADCPLSPCAKWVLNGTESREQYARDLYRDGDLNVYKRVESKNGRATVFSSVYLKFPIRIGDSWANDFTNTGGSLIHETVTVSGWTVVRVMGKDYNAIHFHALDARMRTQTARLSGTSYTQDYYYVPELGVVAKLDSDGFPEYHMELVKIEAGS
jgi:hypothetical protein